MAWISGLPVDVVDPARRSARGEKWSDLPEAGGLLPVRVPLEDCAGCAQAEGHGNPCQYHGYRPVHDEVSNSRIAERPTLEQVSALYGAAAVANRIHCPPPPPGLLDNVGDAADNATVDVPYELRGVSGRTLTVYGENPKRIQRGRSRLNPEWPLPDPETGQTGRIVYEQAAFALPVGAEVRFAAPSVLERKRVPWITKVNVPASNAGLVEFTIEVSARCDAAMEPYDLAYPPGDGKYGLTVRTYQFHPEGWPNFQPRVEQQVTRVAVAIQSADAAAGEVELKGPTGNACRVLLPDMTADTGYMQARLVRQPVGGGVPVQVDAADFKARLRTEQVGFRSWRSWIDLTDLAAANEYFIVRYWATAVAGTVDRMPFAGMCANCQRDASGSYGMSEGWRCTAAESASLVASFKGECWQPQCSAFGLSDGAESYNGGNVRRPPTPWEDAASLMRLWVGVSWVREQKAVGYTGFRLVRPVGAMGSIGQILGMWSGGVAGGLFQQRIAYYGPQIGRRVEYERDPEVEGPGVNHYLVHGAFIGRGLWTAPDVPDAGFCETFVDGWSSGREDARTAAEAAYRKRYPASPIGGHHTYEWGADRGAFAKRTRLVESESWVTGVNPATTDEELEERVRALFDED